MRADRAEQEEGDGTEAFHDRQGQIRMPSSPPAGNWIGLG
jgi:hypothetical protein